MTNTTPAPTEPEEPRPVLHVPVRAVGTGYALRLFKQRDGSRCAVAFTSATALTMLLGPTQRSVRLAEPALRALATPLGTTTLVIDPQLVAPPVVPPAAARTSRAAVHAAPRFPALQPQR
ncbi:SAV_915 family protein [Kitasatospora herbaricolor]|uniref:SseB protein N-terminal domain-containing protein n=1 Tax=Kitasatospora herbaricolor TaxID=68217 RepID=A0ABZ1WIB2_9ACTN|nr:SAV_915 family protein [Kitasatospora herbaricolor]